MKSLMTKGTYDMTYTPKKLYDFLTREKLDNKNVFLQQLSDLNGVSLNKLNEELEKFFEKHHVHSDVRNSAFVVELFAENNDLKANCTQVKFGLSDIVSKENYKDNHHISFVKDTLDTENIYIVFDDGNTKVLYGKTTLGDFKENKVFNNMEYISRCI